MDTRYLGFAAVLLLAGTPLAFAASDGNYTPARMHCTGNANNSDKGSLAEPHCHNFSLVVYDGNGHEYFGWGTQQQPATASTPFDKVDVWRDTGQDPGDGATCPDTCRLTTFDGSGTPPATTCCNFINGFTDANGNPLVSNPKADPATGLHVFFGADDNLNTGEHDSSSQQDNGPSDGGAVVLNLNPASLMKWMAYAMAANVPKLLVHPLPLVDGGIGFCADGICMSTQTTRRDQTYPDGNPNYQPVADYSQHAFDPFGCSSELGKDGPAACGGKTLRDWNTANGDPAIEPGVQIYEDPDAQGSPIPPYYPIPALYVGTCGVIVGGGTAIDQNGNPMLQQPTQFPASPLTNSAGQLVIPTGCDTTADDYYQTGTTY